jgi:hypothetical protein
LKGSVEAFDLAVLPGAVRPDALVGGSELGDDVADSVGLGVAPVVVGHHAFDLVAEFGKEFSGAFDEAAQES